MKIVLDARAASHPQRGGFKTSTSQLIRHIARVDPDNQYLFYLDRPVGRESIPESKNVELKIIPSLLPGIGAAWREQVQIPRHLAKDRPAIAHFTTNTGPLDAPCPTVLTIHDTIGWMERPPKGLPGRAKVKRWAMFLYNRYLSLAAARRAQRIITVSEFSRRDLVERHGFSPERVLVTYEAPSECFHPVDRSAARERVRVKFGLDQPFLLALSSASPRKNARGLLDEYARLDPTLRTGFQLVVVWTHGLFMAQLESFSAQQGLERQVRFLQNISDDDLLHLYNAATIFVFPSFAEGFGLPPLEAMACGTPVVASNLTCMPEILGDAALMIDPREPGQLAEAMAITLSSPKLRGDLSDKGTTWVRRYSWERCARETVQVYADTYAESKSRGHA